MARSAMVMGVTSVANPRDATARRAAAVRSAIIEARRSHLPATRERAAKVSASAEPTRDGLRRRTSHRYALKMSAALEANLEEVTETVSGRVRRPITLMLLLGRGAVVIFAARRANFCGRGERAEARMRPAAARRASRRRRGVVARRRRWPPPPSPRRRRPPPPSPRRPATTPAPTTTTTTTTTTAPKPPPRCGDGKCELPETAATCFADCPGVTTPPQCGEEPHSDPQGHAVVDGRGHHVASAAACCDACAAHAQKNPEAAVQQLGVLLHAALLERRRRQHAPLRRVLAQVADQPDRAALRPARRLHRAYRKRHRGDHLNGKYPTDPNSVKAMEPFGIVPGSQRNLSVPTHVAWAGGVMGARVDLTVSWTTDADGSMRNSKGETVVDYRRGRAASRTSSAASRSRR